MEQRTPRPLPVERLWQLVIQSLWAPETYLKLLFLALTSPFWWPLARAMYLEILPALQGPAEIDRAPRRPAGEDPFLNIPLASYRGRISAARLARTGTSLAATRPTLRGRNR